MQIYGSKTKFSTAMVKSEIQLDDTMTYSSFETPIKKKISEMQNA